jgi:hypothetical protein
MTIKMIKQNGVKYFKFVMDVNFIVLEYYIPKNIGSRLRNTMYVELKKHQMKQTNPL